MAIGNEPVVGPLILTRGADLVHNFDLNDTDPDIPDGATARIEITEDRKPTPRSSRPGRHSRVRHGNSCAASSRRTPATTRRLRMVSDIG